MSTVILGTLQSNSSSPPTFNDNTSTEIGRLCRAFVNFNGTGTVAIRASFNVTSITDNGTGDYTVNFTNALPDANYVVAADGNRSAAFQTNVASKGAGTYTASAVQVTSFTGTGSAAVDADIVNVAIFR